MSKDLAELKFALTQAIPDLPSQALIDLHWQGKADFISDALFPLLGWDNDFNSPYGQWMTYVEWKEPEIDFDDFSQVKLKNLSLNEISDGSIDTFIEAMNYENIRDDDIIQARMPEFYLNYYNQALAKYQLKFLSLGNYENAYLLLVRDDQQKIQDLIQAFSHLNIKVKL